MKKTLPIVNAIALVITIVINYLSNTGVFNGKTMAEVSDNYHNYFTPAAYAFSIWGLIYLGLLAFVIYCGRGLFKKAQSDWPVSAIGWWFVISCIANCCWIVAWLYEYTALSVIIMIILLISLVKIILNTHMELDDQSLKNIAFVWWPFCIYSGWVTVALIANVAAWLTKNNWNRWGLSSITWTVIMIFIAGVINLYITWTRNMREFALVGVWALISIAIANQHSSPAIIKVTAYVVAAILFVSSGLHGYLNRKTNPLKRVMQ